jgi:hypothetical protein
VVSDPDGPLIFGYMPFWPVAGPDEPGVVVCALSTTAVTGSAGHLSVAPWRVPPDLAGDLASQPQAFAYPAAADPRRGVTAWHVGAIGFIEAEALDALNLVLANLGRQAA